MLRLVVMLGDFFFESKRRRPALEILSMSLRCVDVILDNCDLSINRVDRHDGLPPASAALRDAIKKRQRKRNASMRSVATLGGMLNLLMPAHVSHEAEETQHQFVQNAISQLLGQGISYSCENADSGKMSRIGASCTLC